MVSRVRWGHNTTGYMPHTPYTPPPLLKLLAELQHQKACWVRSFFRAVTPYATHAAIAYKVNAKTPVRVSFPPAKQVASMTRMVRREQPSSRGFRESTSANVARLSFARVEIFEFSSLLSATTLKSKSQFVTKVTHGRRCDTEHQQC